MTYDPYRFQQEQDAQNNVFKRLLREQAQGQEPIVHQEDLALLSDLQRRTISEGPYGVQP